MTIVRRYPVQPGHRALSVARARVTLTWPERLLGGLLAGTRSAERKLLRHELDTGFEELSVHTRGVVLHRESVGGPFVFIDAGGMVLFLGGEWLLDSTVVADEEFDPEERWFSEFLLTRSPATGIVLQLQPMGPKSLTPIKAMADPIPYMGESYLLTGSLESLASALADLRDPVPRPEVWPDPGGTRGS